MKILYLKLKNFATISTAMNKKEIEIDFTKCKTNIILLVGANGSGKTSILSTLHPFAYSGSMDVRNSSNVLADGKNNGYKEIHIKNNDYIYKICHYYTLTSKGTITVKSFIKKNDKELNENGNVTSFIEIIKDELSLEQDFLRLLRLGSNVSNLIDMKSIERKNFTSNLLSDINIFTKLFKKINDDNKLLRGLLKTVSDKITKLNIVDKDLLLSEIHADETLLNQYNDEKNEYHVKLGTLEGKIEELFPDGIEHARNALINHKARKKDITLTIKNIEKDINKLCIIYSGNIYDEIEKVKTTISSLDSDIATINNMISFYKNQMSDLYDAEEAINNKLRMFTSDIEYSQIMSLYVELTDKLNIYEKTYGKNYKPTYTKSELMILVTLSQQIDNVISDIYEFDKRAISKVIELIRLNNDVGTFIDKENARINKEILRITSDFKNSAALKNPIILFKPSECNIPECPYLYLYDLLFSDNNENKNSIASLETEQDILNNMVSIHKNIEHIFMMLKTNNSLLEKGNLQLFSVNNILNTIYSGDLINGDEFLSKLASDSEEYENYQSIKIKIKEISAEIKVINSTKGDIENIKNEKTKIFDKISELTKIINDNENKYNDIMSQKNSLEIYLNKLYDLIKLNDEKDDLYKDIDIIDNSIDDLNTKMSDSEKYVTELTLIKRYITELDIKIDKLNKALLNKKISINQFEILSEERKLLNDKFEDISSIRKALSSTEGIPLLFIQLYLKNTKIIVNELLSEIYSDGFEIDDFEITSTDFNIPYIKNGIRISDVVYASQGEKSFLSLALSFALITQSIKDYNILLLDEIDATLDTKNRSLFLTILEKQMDVIDAEQIFLITHNNMFDNYPVDLILTSQLSIENYNNANIIYSN